mgnify:CR=1 FL=1
MVRGPVVKKYWIECTFKYPYKSMPDPDGGLRLTPHGTKISYKKSHELVPMPILHPSDYQPGGHAAKIMEKPVWLVEIIMPKSLISDIRTGSIELEDQEIDLDELDQAYETDLDKDESKSDSQQAGAEASLATPGAVPGTPQPGAM